MAKKNAFLAKQKQIMDRQVNMQRSFTIIQCKDFLTIAASDVGLGKVKIQKLLEAYDAVFVEYSRMAVQDSYGDDTIEYTKAKVDRKLHEIMGPDWPDWDTRYSEWARIYERKD